MDHLEQRIVRLEKNNRRLVALWGLTFCAALLMGFQSTSDLVRARKIEIMDAHGVPLATLGPSRTGNGGELTLRDREGERRAYLTVEPGNASMGLQGGKPDDPSGTAALRADAEGAALGLVGSRASASMSVRKERPRMATTDALGRQTFTAPWK